MIFIQYLNDEDLIQGNLEEFHERGNERYTSSIECLNYTVKNVNYIKHFFPEKKNKFCDKINKLIDVCTFLDISLITLMKKNLVCQDKFNEISNRNEKKKIKYAK